MAETIPALSLVSNAINVLDLGFRVAQNVTKFGRRRHEFDDPVIGLEVAIRSMDWRNESGHAAIKGFVGILKQGPALEWMDKFYDEMGQVFRDLLSFVKETERHSFIHMPWRSNTRQRRLLEKLGALRESWEALLSAIDGQKDKLITDVKNSLRDMRLDDFNMAAVNALLDEKLLLAATQLIDSARRYDVETWPPTILSKTLEKEAVLRTHEAVCGLLQFKSMSNRTSSIEEAFANSYEWIFDERDGKHPKLSEWLDHGNGMYFVAGTEGSGKSTLMKHILEEPRTSRLLEKWSQSGNSSLVIAPYFFWRSGTQLQRSEEGLLRSLIYSVLKERPEFTPRVVPRAWATTFESFLHGSNMTVPRLTAWKIDDLRAAFERLFDLPIDIFFLVDGLDEYQNSQDDKVAPIDMISNLFKGRQDARNVKILASSRPHVDLNKLATTLNTPIIHLHEANQEFINDHVRNNLTNDLNSRAEKTGDGVIAQKIIDYLLSEANGSILWAKLATKMVKTQLSKGCDLETIYNQRGIHLPAGMPGLYQQLWSNMNDDRKKQASEILQIVLAGRRLNSWLSDPEGAMRLVDLVLARGDPTNAIDMLILPWSVGMIRRDCQMVVELFTTAWPDLIRISSKTDIISARIEFCHRSVLEFLESEDTKVLQENSPGPDFCPYISHLKSAVQHLKILPNRLHKNPRPLLWAFAKSALLAANEVDSRKPDNLKSSDYVKATWTYHSLLRELDRTMQYHHENLCKERGSLSGYQTEYLETRIHDADGAVERRDGGRDYKRIAKMHWSNFHYEHKCSHPRSWEDSFLSLAVQFGLLNYVDRELQKGIWPKKIKKGRPLLNYALAPTPIGPYSLITPELVGTLLNHGAKVGEKFEKKSCWENALRWQYETYVEVGVNTPRGSNSEERGLAESRAQIFLKLLRKGANKQVSIETSNGLTFPAKVVVERSFKSLESEPIYQELKNFFVEGPRRNRRSPPPF